VEDDMTRKKLLNFSRYYALEDLAEQVLSQYEEYLKQVVVPPVPVDKIAEYYELKPLSMNQRELGLGVDGVLLPGEKTIVYSKETYETRSRFTIAHEIAHYILNRIGKGEAARLTTIWNSEKSPKKEAASVERCANYMASAILLPSNHIYISLANYKQIDQVVIETLAEKFQVSIEAMLYRVLNLDKLRLIKQRVDYASLDSLFMRIKEKNYAFTIESDKQLEEKPYAENGLANLNIINFIDNPNKSILPRLAVNDLQRLGIGIEFRHKYSRHTIETVEKPVEKIGKPYIIELAGPPNSGKDTQSHILAQYFINIRGYSVRTIEEPYKSCPLDGIKYVEKYIWTILTTCQNLIIERPPRDDMIIINRGIFDSLAYLELYNKLGELSKREYKLYIDLLTQPRWRESIDTVFLLFVSPEVSLLREELQQRDTVASLARSFDPMVAPKPHQNVVNRDILPILIECYDTTYQQYKGLFRNIYMLDELDHVDVSGTAFQLVSKIHNELPSVKGAGQKPALLNKIDFENKNGKKVKEQLALPGFSSLLNEDGIINLDSIEMEER
jgi:Zn-dependent peptidase ImmA (M78 family)/thymidylate kinase